jgi:hypothetical protein
VAKRIYREDAEQRALIQWADLAPMPAYIGIRGAKVGHFLFAIPNGGARNPIEAARLVGLGVRAGVADLFFSYPSPCIRRPKHGLYIEMKAPKPHASRMTDKQTQFAMKMTDAGYECVVCFGWDAARTAIQLYLQQEL